MARFDGVAARRELLRVVPRQAVDQAVRRGRLLIWLPAVLADPFLIDDPDRRRRAIQIYTGGRGAISHTSALELWGLLGAGGGDVVDHVTVPAGVRLRGCRRLVIHQSGDMATLSPRCRNGLQTVSLEAAIATSWPILSPQERRAPAIVAVRERLTTPERLRSLVDRLPRLASRAHLMRLCDVLGQGAHSEFEIWGVEHLFGRELLAASRGQLRVQVGRRVYFIDRGLEAERLAFELDGTRWHDRPEQRARDQRRDIALATKGWQTIRLGYRRLHAEPAAVREELRRIVQARRLQLGINVS